MRETVAAVVVTYNRKHLLVKCLNSLLSQTRPVDKVIIVDNASTDRTHEFLQQQGYLPNPAIDYVRLPENIGGAGGFHNGVKRGYEASYDWLWLMDDDGYPDKHCLYNLLSNELLVSSMFRCPLVIDKDDHQLFSFPYQVNGEIYQSVNQLMNNLRENVLIGGKPFNGTLIGRILIREIGFPKKEMFIWGDEIEYIKRSERHGYIPLTTPEALFFHPHDRQNTVPVLRGLLGRDLRTDNLRLYCFHRNHAYIWLEYEGFLKLFFWSLRQILKKLVSFRFKELSVVVKAIIDGPLGRWGLERKYLQ